MQRNWANVQHTCTDHALCITGGQTKALELCKHVHVHEIALIYATVLLWVSVHGQQKFIVKKGSEYQRWSRK